ncbi:DUF4291 family protein [Streptomyces sp. cg40]|uniref:DUF4291 family protein n=1 Tax=Streptomyces sp. cg40 TaxID=3419764 RepID=UPI003CFBD4AE
MEQPHRQIRVIRSDSTVTVYQAYAPEIGLPAVREGRFTGAWKRGRMPWTAVPQARGARAASRLEASPSAAGRRPCLWRTTYCWWRRTGGRT